MRHYEDFEVGDITEIGNHTVSREEIIGFARQWDPQPFHVDEEFAADSMFGGLIASSCHTYSITGLINFHSPERVASVAMLNTEMRFPNPVRPGDVLCLRSECVEKRLSDSRPGVGIMKTRSTLVDQDEQEKLVMNSVFLIRRRA
ncbi:MAG: MaoC/PaaZ C-terminal domain-containing protein [Myxococcota bacterium]